MYSNIKFFFTHPIAIHLGALWLTMMIIGFIMTFPLNFITGPTALIFMILWVMVLVSLIKGFVS